MDDANAATQGTVGDNIKIPDAVRENFPELIPQILESPSMDDDERNYWFSVLPIMSPDQVSELRDILKSEQDKKAQNSTTEEEVEIDPEEVERQRTARRAAMKAKESVVASAEKEEAENLLAELEQL